MTRLDDILAGLTSSDPQVTNLITKLKLYSQKRYWFEFTDSLCQLIYSCPNYNSKVLIEICLSDLSVYNDPIVMTELLDVYLFRYTPQNVTERTKLINSQREIFGRNEVALEYLNILEASVLIHAGNFEEGVTILKKSETVIEAFREIPKIVYSVLQQTKSLFYWHKKDFDNFYSVAVKWLAYLDEKKLTHEQQVEFAEHILIAGLINNETLSFGNLIEHSIFNVLKNHPQKKIVFDVIAIFCKGEVDVFDRHFTQNQAVFRELNLINSNVDKLKRKIKVIAFYDSVFFNQKQNFEQLSLSFQEIAQIVKIDLREVEQLIVYVLSIGIFQGYIDGLNQKFYISRIKAQEMDKDRLVQLKSNFENWRLNIQNTIKFIDGC